MRAIRFFAVMRRQRIMHTRLLLFLVAAWTVVIASAAEDTNSNGGGTTAGATPPAPNLSDAANVADSELIATNTYFKTVADRYADSLRSSLSCANWDVVAMKYNEYRDKSQISVQPTGIWQAPGRRPSPRSCGLLHDSGIVTTVDRPRNDLPAWVVAFYRLKLAPAPTFTPRDEASALKPLVDDCATQLHNADFLVNCVKTSSGSRDTAFLVVLNDLQVTLASNFDPNRVDESHYRLNGVSATFYTLPT